MKKIISVLTVLCLLVLVFCACDDLSNNQSVSMLNEKLSEYYSGWTVKVTTLKNDVSLVNEFAVTRIGEGYNIDYTVEKLNELSIDASTEFKTTLKGSATVKDGKITLVEGDAIDVDLSETTKIGLKFDNSYFTDILFTTTMFKANVSSPKDFFGSEINCSSMKVTASFDETNFSYIIVSYTANDGANVTCRYDFKA